LTGATGATDATGMTGVTGVTGATGAVETLPRQSNTIPKQSQCYRVCRIADMIVDYTSYCSIIPEDTEFQMNTQAPVS
jgi:hypothetical protein